MASVCNVNDLLEGHVALDIECLDRVYLNGYVPILQCSGQVINFMRDHLGLPVPSPAIFEQIGDRFRAAVRTYAETNSVPLERVDIATDPALELRYLVRIPVLAVGEAELDAAGLADREIAAWLLKVAP